MRAMLKGKIAKAEAGPAGTVTITLSLDGKVDSESPTGREVKGEATFSLAERFARTIRLSDVLSVTIVTEDKEDGS